MSWSTRDVAAQSARALVHDGLDDGVVQLESGAAQRLRHSRHPRLLLTDSVGGTHGGLIGGRGGLSLLVD
jgi:hypothetical protein